jgi:hypothetical protein
MSRRAAAWLGVVLCCGACNPAAVRQANCEWPDEPISRLDLRTNADQRHLVADARRAEEIAIRFADVTRGHRSGHYAGSEEYRNTREHCLATLSLEVASRHAVQPGEVAGAVGQRDERLDASVVLLFTVIFGIAANGVAPRLFVRFPPDDPIPALIAAAGAAVFMSAAGVILGGLGSSVVEMIHVGDMHLSYRAERLPWNQHWLALFAGGLILFAIIATIRWRQAARASTSRLPLLTSDF